MLLRTKLHGKTYEFPDLRILMGKANEEKSGEIAGEKVDSIEKHADHAVSFLSHAYCPQEIEVPLPIAVFFRKESIDPGRGRKAGQ